MQFRRRLRCQAKDFLHIDVMYVLEALNSKLLHASLHKLHVFILFNGHSKCDWR
jgi:hypothetical protein